VGIGLGVVVAIAILVLLPLGAVWAAGRWRDPPRERWGIPAERREAAANTAEMTEFRFRQRLGVADDRKWMAAQKAINRGLAAPAELRAATHELAERRVAELDRRLARSRAWLAWLLAVVGAWIAAVYLARHGLDILLLYAAIWTVRAAGESPWWLRRVHARAVAAVAANA
jgi:hypothetical protein